MTKAAVSVGSCSFVVLLLAACSQSGSHGTSGGSDVAGSSVQVTRADFGDAWPLTVDGGTLACEGAGAVTFTVGGTTYAVNGMASGNGQWPDIDPIWAKGSDTPKKDIGPLIDRGLQLCG